MVKAKHPSLSRDAHADPLTDAMDFPSNRDVSRRRLVAFLPFKFHTSTPTKTSHDLDTARSSVIAPIVRHWAQTICQGVLHELVEAKKDAAEISRLMGGRDGLYMALKQASASIAAKHNLPAKARQSIYYGRHEIGLIQDNVLEDIARGADWTAMMQRLAVVTICFITGLRVGSLCATDRQDDERAGMDASDLRF